MAIRNTSLLLASMVLAVVLAIGMAMIEEVGPAQAAFPGANGKIVFRVYNFADDDYGIKLINQGGSGLTTIDRHQRTANPAFSPDGERVAYAAALNGGDSEIYKINIANRKVTQITNNDLSENDPTWSPDGTRVAFLRGEWVGQTRTNVDIFVRRADGRGTTTNLTETPDVDESGPAWSPNGEEIAFYTEESGDIFVLNLDTGQTRNFTDDGTARYDSNPNWSPDGARIAFESAIPAEPPDYIRYDRIYTAVASDGSDRRVLAQASGQSSGDAFDSGSYFNGLSYSPDGRQIVYTKAIYDYVYTNASLYKMNSSTGGNKQLVYKAYAGQGSDEGVFLSVPDWGVRAQP